MSARSTSALERMAQVRKVQRLSVIIAGSVFAAGSLYSSIAHSQKAQIKPIVKQALTICRAFAADCQSDGEPRFIHEKVPLPYARDRQHPMWYVPLRADGSNYAMILRADTGKLCYAFNLSPWENSPNPREAKWIKTDANRAVNQSLLYLKRLKIVASETQIALESEPASMRDDTGWRVVWKTRSTGHSAEENLRVVIGQKSGRLLQIADNAALNQVSR